MCGQGNTDRFAKANEQMLTRDLMGRDITDPEVLRVMGEVRREEFVPQAYESQAYADGPLPIGMGQTISQPYIVALMTQELHLNRDCTVLEIGTGCGYQTAVLSKLVKKVYTIERFGQLSESAQAALGRLGIDNVEFCVCDGSCGWPQQRWDDSLQRMVKWKPCFDRIMITAAVPKIPQPLFKQLADGGLIIAPVGGAGAQELIVAEKKAAHMTKKFICDVRFVKLFGEYGFEE
ncbi:MAG TPA: protein-L-isoaspartate(D-aspartate) O-methyltransferase [Sedimentisphaerales bacterium]|nr:protein-L-isoaspartate(D-aspartate) O-methyltransferase [Sedimentisphaerales bacterium]